MKRVKRVLALLTVASLTLGPASLVFANDDLDLIYEGGNYVSKSKDGEDGEVDRTILGTNTIGKSKDGDNEDNLDLKYDGSGNLAKSKDGENALNLDKLFSGTNTIGKSTNEKTPDSEKEYVDLAYTNKYVYNSKKEDVGSYALITGADKLNERIAMDLLKILQGELTAENYPEYQAVTGRETIVAYGGEYGVEVSYNAPENFGRYARVSLQLKYYTSYAKIAPELVTLQYYVDKDGLVEISKATFDAVIAEMDKEKATAEIEAAETASEILYVPLAELCEEFGLVVKHLEATNEVVISKRNKTVTINLKTLKYSVDGKEVVLKEGVPVLLAGIAQVPATFFTTFFGIDMSKYVKVPEVSKDEVVIVPVRQVAESIGYTLTWDAETLSTVVSKGEVSVSLQIGKNAYITKDGKETQLEAAPALVDSVMHVPSTFFTKILGVNLTVDDEGTITVTEKVADAK